MNNMRNQLKYQSFLIAVLGVLLLLSSCGGGGGIAGIDGSGEKPQTQVSITGPISGFGSVIVNGVHYNTDNAKIYVRGELAQEMELNVGDYVLVVGEINENGEGVAREVHYQPRVSGLIDWVDIDRNRLAVMGQTIQLVEDTTYSSDIMPRNIEGFKVGQSVTVSGSVDADNVIRATRIQMNRDNADFEVLGAIERLSKETFIFYVDDLKVDYSNVPGANFQVREGKVVTVKGSVLADGALVATEINFELDYRKLHSVDNVELTGFVKNLSGFGEFMIDTLPIKVDQNTQFVGGTWGSLHVNQKVRIEGALAVDDKLLATVVELLPSPDMQVYGTLQSIVPASWGSPYLGHVQVQDHIFWVQFDTRLDGNQERRIRFEDLRVGDTVYVSGFALYGNLIASSIAVDNREFENFTYDIQGYVYAVVPEQKSFSIFNTRVMTNEKTVFGDGFMSIEEAQFYAILTNQYVQVRGYFENYMMVATRVQFVSPWGPPPY